MGAASTRPARGAAAAAAAMFAVASSPSSSRGAVVAALVPAAGFGGGGGGDALWRVPFLHKSLSSSAVPSPRLPVHPCRDYGRCRRVGCAGGRSSMLCRLLSSSSSSGPIDAYASSNFVLDPRSDEARTITSAMGIDDDRHDALADLTDLVVEWNGRINLISRRECTEGVVFGRHVLPSAALCALTDSPLGRLTSLDGGGGEEGERTEGASLQSMTVAKLKEMLKREGKPVSGKKAELIERLQSSPLTSSATSTTSSSTVNEERRRIKVADVGTGGGFPGLPLAILYPQVDFLLVDSVGKKLKVVEAMAEELGLANVEVHHGRVEELVDDPIGGRNHAGAYDAVLGRSVTSLPRFCFWVSDLLRKKRQVGSDGGGDEGGGNSSSDEGKLLYIIGGDVEESVVSRVQSDTPIDELLNYDGASDKRALILTASDVVRIAAESGEVKKKRGPSRSGRSNRSRPKMGQGRAAKGEWKKKDNATPKQRGYDTFKRYNG